MSATVRQLEVIELIWTVKQCIQLVLRGWWVEIQALTYLTYREDQTFVWNSYIRDTILISDFLKLFILVRSLHVSDLLLF